MKKINTQRILLTALVAVAFFGFILWSIQQNQSEEETLYGANNTLIAFLHNKVIKINEPKIGAQIKSPLLISGQANLGGEKLKVRIKDSQGLVLAESFVQVKNTEKMSDFLISLSYKKPSASKGTVEVFQLITRSNSEVNKITIPVIFKD